MRPVAASSATDAAATGVEPGPVRLNVAVLIVAGSMRTPEGTLKVAFRGAPGHTPEAALSGTTALTVGAALVATLPTPLPKMVPWSSPHPAVKAIGRNAMTRRKAGYRWNCFIRFLS